MHYYILWHPSPAGPWPPSASIERFVVDLLSKFWNRKTRLRWFALGRALRYTACCLGALTTWAVPLGVCGAAGAFLLSHVAYHKAAFSSNATAEATLSRDCPCSRSVNFPAPLALVPRQWQPPRARRTEAGGRRLEGSMPLLWRQEGKSDAPPAGASLRGHQKEVSGFHRWQR